MKGIMLKRRRSQKKIAILPVNFTGALIGVTKQSGVVLVAIRNGKVENYMTDIDNGCKNPKEYTKKAKEMLEKEHMSELVLYEWENAGDNFEKLMLVYGGELNPKMSCVE